MKKFLKESVFTMIFFISLFICTSVFTVLFFENMFVYNELRPHSQVISVGLFIMFLSFSIIFLLIIKGLYYDNKRHEQENEKQL